MAQVNASEIIYSGSKKGNRFSAPPRDINDVREVSGVKVSGDSGGLGETGNGGQGYNNTDSPTLSPGNGVIPDTPFIIGIESQTVSNAGNKSVIDVVLNVTDVPNAVEYEVRITKSAGNL